MCFWYICEKIYKHRQFAIILQPSRAEYKLLHVFVLRISNFYLMVYLHPLFTSIIVVKESASFFFYFAFNFALTFPRALAHSNRNLQLENFLFFSYLRNNYTFFQCLKKKVPHKRALCRVRNLSIKLTTYSGAF